MRSVYRSVSLIDKSNINYIRHCNKMAADRSINRHIAEPDSKRLITSWLELSLIKHFSQQYTFEKKNILTWEELNIYNIYIRKFSELDAVFSTINSNLYMEIKASLSKSNLRRGKDQIDKNLQLIRRINSNFSAQLIMADCRCFDKSFGYNKDEIVELMQESNQYALIEGLEGQETIPPPKSLLILNEADVLNLAARFGPPIEDYIL